MTTPTPPATDKPSITPMPAGNARGTPNVPPAHPRRTWLRRLADRFILVRSDK